MTAASGDVLPALATTANPAIFGSPTAPLATISLTGSGFTSSTRAFWDGAAVPLTLVSSNRITITPPAADLSQWGAHDVFVVNGAYRSPTVRQFVARSITGGSFAASDPVNGRLYLLVAPSSYQGPYDLAILDLATGAPLSTVKAISQAPVALALSSDGRYVYLASSSPAMQVTRYDTVAGAVDLQWVVDAAPTTNSPTIYLFPIPASPQSLLVWTYSRGAIIYDRDQPRTATAIGAGFSNQDAPAFVTSSRIYILPTNGYCWRWMDYDSTGIFGGAPTCASDPGPDLVRVNGWTYLSDGSHTDVVLNPGITALNPSSTVFFPDLPNRRILAMVALSSAQITAYNLDTEQQLTLPPLATSYGTQPVLVTGVAGTVLLVSPTWITAIP